MDKEVTSEEQPARRALIDLAKLRSLISAQIERISQSHFVRERDFHSILSVLHPKINVHVITRHAGLIVHRLSYVRRNGEVKRIPRHYRDPARYAAILAQQNVEWRHGTVLLVSKRHALPEQARAAIQRHLNVLTIQTQIWRNLRRDATNDAVKEFQSDIVKWSSRPIEELSRYIATRFVCVVGVINKIENARDPENSNSALTAEDQLVHCTAAPIPPYLLATVRSESVQQLCSESLRYAKVVDASFDLPNQSPSDSGNINEDIFLLPLCRVTEISSPRNQLLIVHRTLTADPSANFTQEEILAMQEIVSQYADHYTRHAGLKALAAMTRMSAELSSSTIEQSDYSPKTEAITLFNWFSRAVVESTSGQILRDPPFKPCPERPGR